MSAARPIERGMVALACIGGLRAFELERMPASCVDMARRCIMIPEFLSKDSAAVLLSTEFVHPDDGHVIPGLPPVIWEWLKLYPFEPHQWAALQNRITAAVGFWIQDGCRKTAAVYYGALRGVAAAEALLHPNRGYHGMVRHHLGQVSRTEAERFYNIKPEDFLDKGSCK